MEADTTILKHDARFVPLTAGNIDAVLSAPWPLLAKGIWTNEEEDGTSGVAVLRANVWGTGYHTCVGEPLRLDDTPAARAFLDDLVERCCPDLRSPYYAWSLRWSGDVVGLVQVRHFGSEARTFRHHNFAMPGERDPSALLGQIVHALKPWPASAVRPVYLDLQDRVRDLVEQGAQARDILGLFEQLGYDAAGGDWFFVSSVCNVFPTFRMAAEQQARERGVALRDALISEMDRSLEYTRTGR